MKVHFQNQVSASVGYEEIAREQWSKNGLVHGLVRSCDQLMVRVEQAASLTNNPSAVTCKRCLKAITTN